MKNNQLKLKQVKRKVTFLMLLFFFSGLALAQGGRSVNGVVLDETGLPLIGVSVQELGSNNGTITNVDGKFVLTLQSKKPTLKFSYLGYQTIELPITGQTQYKVEMKEALVGLQEVVITGYGRAVSKDKLTAAISKVSSQVLESGVRSNPLMALAGTVTGVRVTQNSGQPGKSPSILIRGGASLDGKGEPLYIIDGMQRDDMSDVNSNDIESIEILKDAAATALYGARANNGVVLVTTKTGRAGHTEITFKATVGSNYMRENDKFLNARDYLYWSRIGAQRSMEMTPDRASIQGILDGATPYGIGNNLEANGNLNTAGIWSTTLLNDNNRYLLSQGWQSMPDPLDPSRELLFYEYSSKDGSFQDAWTQDYNLSISGGNDKGKYYTSFGYYDEQGLPLDTYYKRFSFDLNAEYKIREWLTTSGFVNVSNSNTKGIIRGEKREYEYFGVMMSAPPTMRKYTPDGELVMGPNYANGNWAYSIDKFYRRNETFRGTFGTAMKIDFTNYLYLKLNAMWFLNMKEGESFDKAYLDKPGTMNTIRTASASYARALNQTYNAMLAFTKTFGQHNVDAVLGGEFIDRYNFGLGASGKGADSDDFISLQYTTALLGTGETQTSRDISSTHIQERMLSTFFNVNYDYQGKYLFSFSGRYDGYSKLVNNRWGFFPGVSAAWNIYKEDFMKPALEVVDNLKLRAGVGQNGNVNMVSGVYDLQGNYGTTPNYNGNYGFLINKLPYPNLRWEKTTSFDIAVEGSLFNRLRFSVGYFNKYTSDLLASVPFPTSAGVGNMTTNNGSVRSQGMEVELKYDIISNKDLRWRVGFNMTYIRSKIISLPNNGNMNNRQNGMQVYDPTTKQLIWVGGYQEGQEYGGIYAYEKQTIVRDAAHLQEFGDYVDNIPTKPVYGPNAFAKLSEADKANAQQLAPGDVVWTDVNGDGAIDQFDKTYQGRQVPVIMGGFDTSLEWKGISLFARFDYAGGYKQYNNRRSWYMGMQQGTFNTIEDVKETWTPENTGAEYPIFQYADQNYKQNYSRESSMFWENSSYVCAREITLSYSFPKRWLRSILISDATLSVTGQNLFYITGSNLFIPEYGASKEGGYPVPRTYLMGIKVSF